MRDIRVIHRPASQRGVVLMMSLIFLLLLTMMALAASERALLQQKMVVAMHSALQAQWSAESALRGAEWQLFQGHPIACYDSSKLISYKVRTFRRASGWFTAGATTYQPIDYTAMAGSAALAYNPVFIVEYLGVDRMPGQAASPAAEAGPAGTRTGQTYIYRITARAAGGNPNIIRVVESTFAASVRLACGQS